MGRIDVTAKEVADWPKKAAKLNPDQLRYMRKALVGFSSECHNAAAECSLRPENDEAKIEAGWRAAEAEVDELIAYLFPSWGPFDKRDGGT